MIKYIVSVFGVAGLLVFVMPVTAGKKTSPVPDATLGSCYSATAAPVCYELYGARFKKYGPRKCKGKFDAWRKNRKCPTANLRLACDMRVDAAHNMKFFFYDQIPLREARKMCKRIRSIPSKHRRKPAAKKKTPRIDL